MKPRGALLGLFLLAACATPPPPQAPPQSVPAPLPPPPPPPAPVPLNLGPISLPAAVRLPPAPPLNPDPLPWIDRLPEAKAAPLRQALDHQRKHLQDREARESEKRLAQSLQGIATQARKEPAPFPLAAALLFLSAAPPPPRACPPSDPCAGLDPPAPPKPRPAPLGVIDEARRHGMELLDIAAKQEAPSAGAARFFQLVYKGPENAEQELGVVARQLTGKLRTWALWRQLDLASRGPADRYQALLLERSREAGPLQVFALREMARRAAGQHKDEEALQLQFDAIEAHERNKNEEPIVPGLMLPEMADQAATMLLRLTSEKLSEQTPSEDLILPIFGPNLSASVESAVLGGVLQQAIRNNDPGTAEEAASHLLTKTLATAEVPKALAARAQVARRQNSLQKAEILLEQRRAYTLTSPWAEALRNGRGKDGYPGEEHLREALSFPADWPLIAAEKTPWSAFAPQLRAMLVHCLPEGSSPGPLTVIIQQEQYARRVVNEAELSEPVRGCLERNGYAFLTGLPEDDWVLRLEATVISN